MPPTKVCDRLGDGEVRRHHVNQQHAPPTFAGIAHAPGTGGVAPTVTSAALASQAAARIEAESAAAAAASADSDDEMSGNESQRSGRSVEEHDSSGEDADEPDSDDSSEMDESECERRRSECMNNISSLERQFLILREQLYCERISQVDKQLFDIGNGVSQEYLVPLQELNETLRTRTEVATILRTLQITNIQHKFESEELAASQHFESEKRLALDNIYDDLMDKVRRLEEDRQNVDISWAHWGSNPRTSKVRGPAKKKAVTVTGPYVVYMLNEDDIMDDWKTIQKALKRRSSPVTVSSGPGIVGGLSGS